MVKKSKIPEIKIKTNNGGAILLQKHKFVDKCNPKIENSHRWSEPDYRYPLMCLDCHMLITWVRKLSKLERPLITLEQFRYLDKKGVESLYKKMTYEEVRLMINELDISKYLWHMVNGNNELAEKLANSWPKTSKEIYLWEVPTK